MIAELAIATIIATHYAHKPVTVECYQFGRNDPTLGDAFAGDDKMRLSARVCGALRRPTRTPRFAEAVLTVIHEALHLKGDTNEDRVECEAARRTPAALYHWFRLSGMQRMVRQVTYRPGCVQ